MEPATMPPLSSARSAESDLPHHPFIPSREAVPEVRSLPMQRGAPATEGPFLRPGERGREAILRYLVSRIAELAQRTGRTIGYVESGSVGSIARTFAEAPEAPVWFRGAVLAYSPGTGHRRGDAPSGPDAVRAMAGGVRELLASDIAVAVSGIAVGGSGTGSSSGTVLACVSTSEETTEHRWVLDGNGDESAGRITELVLRAVLDALIPKTTPAPVPG